MLSDIHSLFKKYKDLILFLAFAYAATIVFPAFGPALKAAVGSDMPFMSTVAFLFYVVGFFFPPNLLSSSRIKPRFVTLCILLLAPAVLFLDMLPLILRWITVSLFSLLAGQLGSTWTQFFRLNVKNSHRGRVVALSLALTFFILYSCTLLINYSSVRIALMMPIVLMLMSSRNLSRLHPSPQSTITQNRDSVTEKSAYILYAIFIIIYISGGFTYAGIFPKFENYAFISKYYNVQPLFLTVLLAGVIADKVGRKTILYIGFGMVGLSFVTFMLPVSYSSYFLTQSFTQIGWGFINTFVWVVSADLSIRLGKPTVAARGVACMLFGTVLGAITAHLFNQSNLTQDALYAAVTLSPLFVGLILISFVPETLMPKKASDSFKISAITSFDIKSYEVFSSLTRREKEVVSLLLEEHTRLEICTILSISINTLKTHIRHIYKKLGVTGKESLLKLIEE